MIAVECNPGDRVPSGASGILSLDVSATTVRRFRRRLRGTSVGFDESVANGSAHAGSEHTVMCSVRAEVSDGNVSTRASAEVRPRVCGDSAENVAASARHCI